MNWEQKIWQAYRSILRAGVGSLILSLATPGFAALDPSRALTQYTQDLWTMARGLPNNSILAIAQTPDGYLWLGTEEGLVRFDGVRSAVFDKQLKGNHVSALLTGRNGSLWIGTQGGGLTQLSGGAFKTFTKRDGLTSDSVLSLYEDASGVLWAGTDGGGLNRFDGRTFTSLTTRNGLPNDSVFAIAGSADGSLWAGTHGGLALVKNGAITSYTDRDGLSDNYIRSLAVGNHHDLWIGTNSGGLNRFENGRFTHFPEQGGNPSGSVWSLYRDSAGSLWAGSLKGGLSRFSGSTFASYPVKEGLPSNRVFAIFEDREGSLWLGTGGSGLVQMRNGSFAGLSTKEGLSNDVTLPVMEDREGALWIGTNGGGVNRVKDGRITAFTTAQGLSDNLVFSIAEDGAGTLWVSTQKGLDRFKQGRFVPYRGGGLPQGVIFCLYRDRRGSLWAGSRGGLSRFNGDRFETYTTENGLSSNFVVSLYEDPRHVMWIGTRGGLNKLEAGKFSSYTTKDGLSSDALWSLAGDQDGTLWIGTSGGGLNRLRNGRFTAYTTADGLLDDEIYQILDDQHGFLWMSSNKGVFRVDKTDLAGERPVGGLHIRSFGTADGFRNQECNGGFQPAGWRRHDGRLVFPTMKGVAVADPLRLELNRIPPPVAIEGVLADGVSFDARRPISVQPGRGQLQFNFTALSLVQAEKTRFKYRLEGFEREWTSAGERRVAYYTNIPPGPYRFRVMAANADGVWNETGSSVEVDLRPHYYQTAWFVSLCVALALGVAVGLYRLRIRQLHERERRLVRVVDERTHALQEQVEAKEKAHAELADAQQRLMELSRQSGMAEVATGVLHNVGNVLNSVNVGASVIGGKLRESRLDHLQSAVKLLDDHSAHLTQFVAEDPKGQRLIPYLRNLAAHLLSEREWVLGELEDLSSHIDHIKEIVSTQQDYAKVSTLVDLVSLPKLVDDAVRMVQPSAQRDDVTILRDVQPVPDVLAAKHKILEILVNLLQNAVHAILEQNGPVRVISIRVRRHGDSVRVEVRDTGIGLARENLTRVFGHGFTTKSKGHGFGLHSGAIAAKQMNAALWAESDGPGLGATFVLELPLPQAAESAPVAAGVDESGVKAGG